MPQKDTFSGLRYALPGDPPSVDFHTQNLVTDLQKVITYQFTSPSARDSHFTSGMLTEGLECYVAGYGTYIVGNDLAWHLQPTVAQSFGSQAVVGSVWDGSSPIIRQTFTTTASIYYGGSGFSNVLSVTYPTAFPHGVISFQVVIADSVNGAVSCYPQQAQQNLTAIAVKVYNIAGTLQTAGNVRFNVDVVGW